MYLKQLLLELRKSLPCKFTTVLTGMIISKSALSHLGFALSYVHTVLTAKTYLYRLWMTLFKLLQKIYIYIKHILKLFGLHLERWTKVTLQGSVI